MTRRAEFPTSVKREAYDRSNGICECHRVWCLPTYGKGCGVALGEGNTFYEHIDPDAISKRNDMENCATLCKTCWRLKTSSYDQPVVADVKRMQDRARNIKARSGRRLPGCRDSEIKARIGAPPVYRDSGRPVWGPRR